MPILIIAWVAFWVSLFAIVGATGWVLVLLGALSVLAPLLVLAVGAVVVFTIQEIPKDLERHRQINRYRRTHGMDPLKWRPWR